MLPPFRSRTEQQVPSKKVSWKISFDPLQHTPPLCFFQPLPSIVLVSDFQVKCQYSTERQSRIKQVRSKCQALKRCYWGSFPLLRPFLQMSSNSWRDHLWQSYLQLASQSRQQLSCGWNILPESENYFPIFQAPKGGFTTWNYKWW